ncbi:hypothetical protein LGQ02_10450 [Bacillus shivajii]|uniref:hypothetical protein n=1 Tax=Bacillus shivajii TaxID=1983719 RepID=UPI001CFB84DC|nr:hypothetical protein [Bacillus shivajii]UCZ55107.1 hypothetical protein LGQ02_10450 [Bacillus shivajii]
MKKVLIAIVFILLIVVSLLGMKFGSALTQEENTFDILIAITKLEFSEDDYIYVGKTEQEKRFVSKNIANSQKKVMIDFMEQKEWVFKDQLGSGYIFEKDEEDVVVTSRLYTSDYVLWNVPFDVFN